MTPGSRFLDRAEAGRQLGERLAALRLDRPLVLALPRGGVAVAVEVAERLDAPLDVLLVRKIGAPFHREFAIGAVVEGPPPEAVVDIEAAGRVGADADYVAAQRRAAGEEIARRRELYRGGAPLTAVQGRTVVLVDDGIATGATVKAALGALRGRGVERLVLAVPVAAPEAVEALRRDVDELVCLAAPEGFRAVGFHYDDFHQLDDDEVVAALASAKARRSRPPGADADANENAQES